jgi:membrane protein YqaA with SNARE-associated domain
MQDSPAGENVVRRVESRSLKHLAIYFCGFVVFCLILYLIGRVSGEGSKWWSLFLLYMSFANTFVPLPTNPVIIGLGRTYEPLLVGLLGAIGTSVANLNEYHVISYISSKKFADRVKKRRMYLKFQEWYWKYPFSLLTLTNFLPIPVDPVRWMSISSGYSRFSYAAATFAGRAPRYYLLALLGEAYQFSNRFLILLVIIPAAYSVIRFLIRKIKAKH